jgi:uncharacterized metal-binding protein
MENTDHVSLYNAEDRSILKIAEDSLDSKLDRVEEIIEYAHEAGLKKIGIANCTIFNKEALLLSEILSENGFTVKTVNCKYGKVPFTDLVEGYKGISCNPAGQAKYLEEKGTELNIMMGLCLGHDMIFNAKSVAPVTTLVVKDRVMKHKTIEILKKEFD